MEDHSVYNKQDTDLCHQLSNKNPWCLVACIVVTVVLTGHPTGTLEMDWSHSS